MKSFAVYRHPSLGYEAVKEGFSWPAFFFTLFWALVKGLWVQALALLLVTLLLSFEPSGDVGFFVQLGACFLFGFQGNRWRISALEKRGYEFVLVENADNADTVIARARSSKPPL